MSKDSKEVTEAIFRKLKLELEMERMYHLQARTCMIVMGNIIKHVAKNVVGYLPMEKQPEFRAMCDIAALEIENYKKLFGETKTKSDESTF